MIQIATTASVQPLVKGETFEKHLAAQKRYKIDLEKVGRIASTFNDAMMDEYLALHDQEHWMAIRDLSGPAGDLARDFYVRTGLWDNLVDDFCIFAYPFLKAIEIYERLPTSSEYLEVVNQFHTAAEIAEFHRIIRDKYGEIAERDLEQALRYRILLPWAGFIREWHAALFLAAYIEENAPDLVGRVTFCAHPLLDTSERVDWLMNLDDKPLVGLKVSMKSSRSTIEMERKDAVSRYVKGLTCPSLEIAEAKGTSEPAVAITPEGYLMRVGNDLIELVREADLASKVS
jgi:hypothetical protein